MLRRIYAKLVKLPEIQLTNDFSWISKDKKGFPVIFPITNRSHSQF